MSKSLIRNKFMRACVMMLSLLPSNNIWAQKHSAASAHLSYTGLSMTGYQGWFGTPEDGVTNRWRHYNGPNGFKPGSASIEYWPDMREADKDEKYITDFVFSDGSPAYVFSSAHAKTVDRHFQWMKEYGIDGAFMQRFRSDFGIRPVMDTILGNALQAARAHGRAISLMYDIGANIHVNGVPDDNKRTAEVNLILNDWKALVDNLGLTTGGNDQPYLYHKGKPLIVLWGVGFNHRHNSTGLDIQYWVDLVDSLQNNPEYGGCSIMLGVPRSWRTGGSDCISGAEHAKMLELIKTVDIIQPWHTSRYSREQMATRFKSVVTDDIAWCKRNGIDYTPTISPGIREKILHGNNYEQNREGGYYFWDMARAAIEAGSEMLYLGMFDEVDEGTQYHKINNNPPFYSNDLHFANYGSDPEDHYLWLAGEATRALKGEFIMGPTFRKRADNADFRSELAVIDHGTTYAMELTTPASGRRVFYADPYKVPDGAPTVGTKRDSDLFINELSGATSFSEQQRGRYIRLVEVNAADEIVAFKALVAAHSNATTPYVTSYEEDHPDRAFRTAIENAVDHYLTFDGNNDVVDCGRDPSLQIAGTQITLEAWFKINNARPAIWHSTVLAMDHNEAGNDVGYFLRANGNGQVNWGFGDGTWHEVESEDGIQLFERNTWNHVAGVYNGTVQKLFLNGNLIKESTVTASLKGTPSEHLYIGAAPSASDRVIDAGLAEVRIWHSARTDSQIKEFAQKRITGSETGLAAYWPMTKGEGQTILDMSPNNNVGILGKTAAESDADPVWTEDKTTSIEEDTSIMPEKYNLKQNYPNPFNPKTTITFFLPQASPVKLTVYNTLGQKVRVLVDDDFNAGSYRVDWDGRDQFSKNAATGIYFYSLESASGITTRNMALIK